jgi:hypothetical protein
LRSKKEILQEIDMDFIVRFSLDTRLLKSRRYFTKKDFVIGLSNKLSVEECEEIHEAYKQGIPAKVVSAKFLLTKNPTAQVISNNLIKYLISKYKNILNNIIFKEFLLGNFRTDINLINGTSYTYEIKTARDRIEKAVPQTNYFARAFEHVYLVIDDENVLPTTLNENVGIIEVGFDDGELRFNERRPSIKNYSLSSDLQLNALRKDELGDFFGSTPKDHSREELVKGLLETETEEHINAKFKMYLKERFRPQWYEYIRKNLT